MRIVVYKIPNKEKILYNLGLLLCKLFKNKKIGILCEQETIDFIDKTLWTFSTNIFLPHDIVSDDKTFNDKQPVLLSCDLKYLNRDILCVLTKNDLFFTLSNCEKLNNVSDLIFITQGDFDVGEINKYSNANKINVFEKKWKSWQLIV